MSDTITAPITLPAAVTINAPLTFGYSVGGGADGDRGSISVSDSGATWTINPGAVSNDMLAGSISLAKLITDPLARANHTGTQSIDTLTGFGTGVEDSLAAATNGTGGLITWGSSPRFGDDGAGQFFEITSGRSVGSSTGYARTCGITFSGGGVNGYKGYFSVSTTSVYGFSGSTDIAVGEASAAFSLVSAGLVGLGTGAAGSTAGSLALTNLTASGTVNGFAGIFAGDPSTTRLGAIYGANNVGNYGLETYGNFTLNSRAVWTHGGVLSTAPSIMSPSASMLRVTDGPNSSSPGDLEIRNLTASGTVVGKAIRSTPYNAGNLTGNVTLAESNGDTQYGTVTGNIIIQAPSGTPVECSSEIQLILRTNTGQTLDFDAAIKRASDSSASFPKTLTTDKSYILKLKYMGGYWCLVTLVGGFDENI